MIVICCNILIPSFYFQWSIACFFAGKLSKQNQLLQITEDKGHSL